MNQVVNAIRTFVQSEDGPTAVEYGVLVAFIVAAVIVAAGTMQTAIKNLFSTVSTAVGDAADGA